MKYTPKHLRTMSEGKLAQVLTRLLTNKQYKDIVAFGDLPRASLDTALFFIHRIEMSLTEKQLRSYSRKVYFFMPRTHPILGKRDNSTHYNSGDLVLMLTADARIRTEALVLTLQEETL